MQADAGVHQKITFGALDEKQIGQVPRIEVLLLQMPHAFRHLAVPEQRVLVKPAGFAKGLFEQHSVQRKQTQNAPFQDKNLDNEVYCCLRI